MDQQVPATRGKTLPRWELISLTAALMASNALAIDVMLPALQQIGASLGVENENHRQFVITAFIAGMGCALLFFGPISDRYGRKIPLAIGMLIYVTAAFATAVTENFTALLVCRFIQGIGAASTRVIAISIVRDQVGGRAMAEIMSLVFVVFMAVPIIAPGLGQVLMLFWSWHSIFIMMGVLGSLIIVWLWLRLPETLHEEHRRSFTPRNVLDGFRIVLTNRISLWYTIALTVMFGALFGFINSAQQIYQGIYDVGAMFPVYFAAVAGLMAVSSFLNSRLVGRIGMRRLSHTALLGFIACNATVFTWSLTGPVPLWAFTGIFGLAMLNFSWIGSNFNSLAMEPVGHVAGTASSVQGFIQTGFSGFVGALIGQAFNGTITPLAAGYFGASLLALAAVLIAERGKLFRSVSKPV